MSVSTASAKQARYYAKNRERILEARRLRYEARRDEILEDQKERRRERAASLAKEKRERQKSGLDVVSGERLATACPDDEPLLSSVHTLYGRLINHCLICYQPTPAVPEAQMEHLELHRQELADYNPDRHVRDFKGRRTARQTMLLAGELRAGGLIELAIASRLDITVKHLRRQIRRGSAATG